MKLSNKILIGFFAFIFIYMTAAFTELRLKGDPNRIDEFNGIVETVGIAGVRYLVLPDLDHNISVLGSNDPRIEVRSISGDILQYLKYSTAGDTLTIESFNLEEDQHVHMIIHVPKNSFTGLTSNNAGINISELELPALSISQNDGWIRLDANNKLERIKLVAEHGAYFNLNGAELDTLAAIIDGSEVTINSSLDLVKGSMSNKSYLNLNGTKEIQFKKDKGSRLYLN